MPSIELPIPDFISDFFSGRQNYTNAAPRLKDGNDAPGAGGAPQTFNAIGADADEPNHIQLKVCPEAWRFVAYVFFWSMCAFAIACNNYLVAPILLEGPVDGAKCPPFGDGKGFDVHTNSHLNRLFGFNNVRFFCSLPILSLRSCMT